MPMFTIPEFPPEVTESIPVQYQLWITWGFFGIKYLHQLLANIRKGGGLKRAITTIWLGESVPTVIAKDYKEELK
jgi:hypothetical protein